MERAGSQPLEKKEVIKRRTVPNWVRSKVERIKGFTLIELLVAMTIFSIVAVALYSTMRTGIDAWRRSDEAGGCYQEARLTFTTMARELGNINTTFGEEIEIPFRGEPDRISFPALVNTANPGEPARLELGRITYYLEKDKGSLRRRQETYIQTLNDDGEPSEELASSIVDLGFEFYYEKVEDEELSSEWRSSWESDEESPNIPRGVRVALSVKSKERPEDLTFTRTIWVPMGKPGKLEE